MDESNWSPEAAAGLETGRDPERGDTPVTDMDGLMGVSITAHAKHYDLLREAGFAVQQRGHTGEQGDEAENNDETKAEGDKGEQR